MFACQDWRDFNVHCAAMNYFLARYISRNFDTVSTLVLTGDFMNEYMADYTSEYVDGVEYYPQLTTSQKVRQRFFVNGLDSSDREVGVFSRFHLSCFQPYSLVAPDYQLLNEDELRIENAKYVTNRRLVPDAVFKNIVQGKVRAQVGDSGGGILGHFVRNGYDQDHIKRHFFNKYNIDQDEWNRFVNVGAYRT
jgi:hypothetical protein